MKMLKQPRRGAGKEDSQEDNRQEHSLTDGVWLVQDGYCSRIMRVGDVPDPMPLAAIIRHREHIRTAIEQYLEQALYDTKIMPDGQLSLHADNMTKAVCQAVAEAEFEYQNNADNHIVVFNSNDDDQVEHDDSHELDILVVDDNRVGADALSLLLTECGHNVRTAYCGEEALKTAFERKPELVFLDIEMPGISGFAVCCELRNSYGLDMTIVAVTGLSGPEAEEKANSVGFNRFINKPYDPEVIIDIAKALSTPVQVIPMAAKYAVAGARA